MSFWDLLSIPSRRPSVLLTDMEESAWLRVVLKPLIDIYLANQLLCSCSESSEIPRLFISTTVDTMAGPAITKRLLNYLTIFTPNSATISLKLLCFWNP